MKGLMFDHGAILLLFFYYHLFLLGQRTHLDLRKRVPGDLYQTNLDLLQRLLTFTACPRFA